MSLTTLPEEVLEILFSYLDAEDLLKVWTVVGLEGSDSFWKKVCKREGFKKVSKEDASWKTVFYRNTNWMTYQCLIREYKFDKYERDLFDSNNFRNIYIKDTLHGKNLIVKSGEDEISLWNLDEYPVLIKTLPANFFIVSCSKLLTYNFNVPHANITIYSANGNSYCDILNFDKNLSMNVVSDYALTDEYFAAVDDSLTSIFVVNLETKKNCSLPISTKKVKPISIVILEYILNVMVLESSQYVVLRRYNLQHKEWLDDLLLFQGAALINIPKLIVSTDLLVSWSNLLIRHGITPIKVWKSDGQLFKSLSFEFISMFGIKLQMPPEQILWLVVEGEYIILSTYVTSITIWTSKEPDVCKEMPKSEHGYNGQSVVSSRLLVLSYTFCFQVVDFQKAVYLYNVSFGNEKCISRSSFLPQPYFVNEYFYVYFKEFKDEGCEKPSNITANENLLGVSSSTDTTRIKPDKAYGAESKINISKSTKTCILTVYDFRA